MSWIASVNEGGNACEKPVPIKENKLAKNKTAPKIIFMLLMGFIIGLLRVVVGW